MTFRSIMSRAISLLRSYGWRLACALLLIAAVPAVRKFRQPDLHGHVFRMGYEYSPPAQFIAANGGPSGAVIDILREAARRRGIRLNWVRSELGPEHSMASRETDLWPL